MQTTTHPQTFASAGADAIWVAFVLVQALDGALTMVGIGTIGLGIEANPLIAWCAQAFGPAAALLGAKMFAVACGVVLYLTGRFQTLASLVVLYVVLAVGPWVHLLSSHP